MPSKKIKTDHADRPEIQLTPRRITPASFRSPLKRRRAARTIARTKMASGFGILWQAMRLLRNHWEVFGGLFLVYALVNTLLAATSLLSVDLGQTKDDLTASGVGQVGTAASLLESLMANNVGTATGSSGAYQMVLLVIMSLATVWALRQLVAGNRIRVRDALYNSSYPFVQVMLLLLVIAVQLLPAALGALLINLLLVSGVLIVGWQQFLTASIVFLLFVWTLYMLACSIIALYVVSLPGMTPWEALRSAKDIVGYRRATVLRKLLFLPVILVVMIAVIVLPLSLIAPLLATVVFFILGMAVVPLVHAYIYSLYRELIK